jgi:hypothetical protein
MISKWSRHDACLNCESRRHPHDRHGYCKRCWPMAALIKRAENWNRQNSDTMKDMPSNPAFSRDAIVAGLDRRQWSDEEFERYRSELIRQYRNEMKRLRLREQSRQIRITGWDIERQLGFVHRYIRPKATRKLFYGIGRSMEDRFDKEQRSIIFGLLLDLIDHVPWKGVDGEELWRRVCCVESADQYEDTR